MTGRDGFLARRRSAMRQDQGIGLILVIGITAFVTILASTAAIIAVNGLAGSRQRTAFEQSLAAAESGVDYTLARLQRAWDTQASDYPIPNDVTVGNESAPTCDDDPVTAPTSFASAAAERTWASGQLTTLAASHPECIRTTSSGQWLVFKPKTALVNGLYPRYGHIYSIGWYPSRAHATATRTIKSDYIFMPYRPQNAILTGGDLGIASSLTVTALGSDPTVAAIHANGVISPATGGGGGQPSVSGPVTATGGSTGLTGLNITSSPIQNIPYVSAYSFYKNAPNNDDAAIAANQWFDLCTDGTARPYSLNGPCDLSTTPVGSGINGSSVRGWSYDAANHAWIASKDTQSGVYYVNGADVKNGTGNATIANLTVIAAASGTDCSKSYGNITWDHYDMVAPAFHNLFLYADADIYVTSNVSFGNTATSPPTSGMFIAGDQMDLETSSNSVVGAVIAADQCTNSPLVTSNVVKNVTLTFDPKADSPFTSIITTTLWAEFPGS